MPTTIRTVGGKNGEAALDLAVTVSGMVITVPAGAFINQGHNYVLASDQNYSVGASAQPRYLEGYLVKVVSTGALDVLVDEIVLDGVDVPYNFGDGTYEVLHRLFDIHVPENTIDLAPLELRRLQIVPRDLGVQP